MCEEFHCTPAQARQEDPTECLNIIEARAYAEAKQRIEQSKSEADVPWTPMVQRVWDNVGLDYAERMRRRDA